jgi:hypothetical protein
MHDTGPPSRGHAAWRTFILLAANLPPTVYAFVREHHWVMLLWQLLATLIDVVPYLILLDGEKARAWAWSILFGSGSQQPP